MEISKLLILVLIFFFIFQSQGQNPTSIWKDKCALKLHAFILPSRVLMLGDDGTGHWREQGFSTLYNWLLDKAGYAF